MKALPYYKQQTPFTCSLACLRMVLESFGRKFTEEELAKIIKFHPDEGMSIPKLAKVCEIINVDFEFGKLLKLEDLKSFISKNSYPIVIVDVKTFYKMAEIKHGHFIIIKDITEESVIFNDPDIEFGGENKVIGLDLFLESWMNSNEWALIIKGDKND